MSKNKKSSISVFFPCYNDAQSINKLVRDAFLVLPRLASDYEVIVVDDGSTDRSPQVLKNLVKEYKKLKLVFHDRNLGYGGALRSGFASASGDLVFYTDGDGQYDVKELPLLFGAMGNSVDFVNGIKSSRYDPTYRVLLGNFYSFLARWVFWLPVYDVDCDFRLMRKTILQKIQLKSNSGSICVELVKKAQRAGARFRQISVHHYERRWGNSQFFQTKRILKTFWELFFLWIELIVFKR